mmetsp:Transcript_15385/g.22712  ORF Transcript_15385/g.22712 Transcript_15385/m.22712 type:complete len:304 (-) Transcript_15385:177-1088(-)
MTGVLTKLHKENGTSDDLVGHLNVCVLQIILVVNETDTLSSSSLTGLNHDTLLVSDLLCSLNSLLNRTASGHLESVIGDGTLGGKLGNKGTIIHTSKRSTPWDGRHLSGLGENVGSNFISKYTHHGTGRSNELDSERIEGVWQFGVLTSMTPARPYSINTLLLGDFANNINVGVVVGVLSSRNLNERIGQTDELSIGFEILGGSHGYEGDRLLVSELHVSPLPHGKNGFGCGHTVVGNEDLTDGTVSAAGGNIILQFGASSDGLIHGRHGELRLNLLQVVERCMVNKCVTGAFGKTLQEGAWS